MADMRNVNNWHWVNKDCRPWAKNYLTEKLVGTSATKDNSQVVITSLDECIGDVDLNQRKGKLLAIYDVALKMSWQGKLTDGSTVYGNITVPEVAYDTDISDYVFNIQINGGPEDEIKRLIRSDLVPLLATKFSRLTRDLVDQHSFDLYADKSSAPSTPELVQRNNRNAASTPSSPATTRTAAEDKVVQTSVIEHSCDFTGATPREIYEALLDSQRAEIWSHGKAKVSKRIGTDFELFDGNVHGTLMQATPGKSIMQTWRLKNWPQGHFSTVTLTFKETQDGTTVKVNQVGVPVGQEEVIRKNWMGYYWNAIKTSLNKGQLQHLPIQNDPVLGLFDMKYLMLCIFMVVLVIAFTAYQVAPTIKM
ncbi:hsp90 co-chaperone AHA1 [Mucor ambiguus]|uniref:Hsp90 co-chaperone AHA1 n=1 Tax=Mucor ambiguus TaxID=91626 RepID=A0A0C9MAV2_9FUNG|nr:hsp90 co-chaperone AHA1 [Mucor ambiguus]